MASSMLHSQAQALRNLDGDDTDFSRTPASSPATSVFDRRSSSSSLSSLSSLHLSDHKTSQTTEQQQQQQYDSNGNEWTEPTFTIKDIRSAIPRHCFDRSAPTSLYYVLRDFTCIAVTFYLFYNFAEYVPTKPLRFVYWIVYGFLQGLFGTGLFVLGHECGHGGFSSSKLLNDSVGMVVHSFLLVPYFSWKITHGKHHKNAQHMDRDMNFVPVTRDQYASRFDRLAHTVTEMTEEAPAVSFLRLALQLILGFPLYLATNASSNNNHERQREGKGKGKQNGNGVNHYYPSSPLFDKKDEHLILLSDAGVLLMAGFLFYIGWTHGFANVYIWYFQAWIWVNSILIANTLGQHTDPSLPHFSAEKWSFINGAVGTMDRSDWGWVERHLFHSINETHTLHHFCSNLPHYHAVEATEAIRKVMGKHYNYTPSGGPMGYVKSLYANARMCQWVEEAEGAEGSGVFWFRNRNGLGVAPKKLEGSESDSDSVAEKKDTSSGGILNSIGLGMLQQNGK